VEFCFPFILILSGYLSLLKLAENMLKNPGPLIINLIVSQLITLLFEIIISKKMNNITAYFLLFKLI
jgi:hypothetical protein